MSKLSLAIKKLMYLRVTNNDIRYYAYGHFGYLYDAIISIVLKPSIQMIC